MSCAIRKVGPGGGLLLALGFTLDSHDERALLSLRIAEHVLALGAPDDDRYDLSGGEVTLWSHKTRSRLLGSHFVAPQATNIAVAYREGDKGGVFYRDRLMGRDSFSFTEHEFQSLPPEDLPVSGDSFMKIGWIDAGGSHSSPIYQWGPGRSGAPILAGDATDAPAP